MENSQIDRTDLRLKVAEKQKLELIQKWGISEALLIIAAAEQAVTESLSQISSASEVAELVSKNFRVDPTHMSDKNFRKYLDKLATDAERELASVGS